MPILNWLSSLVKAAFLRGVREAIEELRLTQDQPEEQGSYFKALPAPDVKRKKP